MPGMYVRRLAESGVCTDSRTAEEMAAMLRDGLPQPWSEQVYRIDARTVGVRRADGGEDNPADVFRWEDPADDPYAVIFGKVDGARKVHMAYAESRKLLCRKATHADVVLCGPGGMYPAPAAEGQEGTIAALLMADVSPSNLCRSCFYPRTVLVYAAAYRKKDESAEESA
ncbi:hypothetical protein [Amycolatopsis sp. NPDC021455]|uniref:hypothetical protein n=1 Tax=Amycolatopsis sp. NPDC021455 TaxID=3154901 RepID=UPI0033C20F80